MFSPTVPLNRNGSWLTTEMFLRSDSSEVVAMPCPSMVMAPPVAS